MFIKIPYVNTVEVRMMKIREAHFSNEWLTVLLIAKKEAYQKAYFECTCIEGFKEQVADSIEKSKRIGQKVITQEDKTEFVERVNAVLPDFMQSIHSTEDELHALVEGDAAIETRLLTKAMLLTSASIKSEFEWWEGVLSEKADLVMYLGMKHFLAHLKGSKIAKTKKPWMQMLGIQYTENFWPVLRLEDIEKTQQEIVESHDALKKESLNKDRIITDKKNNIAKLNEKVTDLTQKLNQKNKVSVVKEVERLESDLSQMNALYLNTCSQMEALEGKLKLAEANQVSHQKVNDLEKALALSHKQVEKLKTALEEAESRNGEWREYNLITELSDYLEKQGMTLALKGLIEPYLQISEGSISVVDPRCSKMTSDYFGYCEIMGGVHYIVSLEGSRQVLKEIPDDLYLGQGQIVLADQHHVFLESFLFRYIEDETELKSEQVVQIGLVVSDDVFMVEVAGDERVVLVNKTPFTYHCGCVVGLNANHEIVKAYEGIRFNADLFMDSVVARHQKAYVVERVIGESLIAREIPNGETRVIPTPEQLYGTIETPFILFVKNNSVIKCLKSVRFFTTTKAYAAREKGQVICDEQGIFVERWNGEKRLLAGIPETTVLEAGDQVVVDEYMHFIEKEYVCCDKASNKPVLKKYKKTLVGEVEDEVCQMHPERVLIIGDVGLQQSYKLGLFKKGYCAEVVSGVESWNKIEKAARQSDVIVYVTDHAKHMHFHKFRAEFADKVTLYAAFEGPNRIVEMLDERFGG